MAQYNFLDPQGRNKVNGPVKKRDPNWPLDVPFADGTFPDGPKRPIKPEATIVDKAAASGQAGVATFAAATIGSVGMLAGNLKGLGHAITSGDFGSQKSAGDAEKIANQFISEWNQKYVYTPDNKLARQYLGNVAEALTPLQALTPAVGTGLSHSVRHSATYAGGVLKSVLKNRLSSLGN